MDATAVATSVCPRCKSPLEGATTYCHHCGFRLDRPTPVPLRRRSWWKVFVIGIVLYYVELFSLALFGNPNIVPTVIVIGAFVVPAAFVMYVYERGALYDVPLITIALTFFYGGVLGTIVAQFLEVELVRGMGILAVLAVGFSEELAKLIGVVWLLRRKDLAGELHGLVLGAAAGMGFAAFESMGYGFTFLVQSKFDIGVMSEVLITRGLLSPLAHGTWTAIVTGVLWRERAHTGRWFNRKVLGAFVIAIVLHAAWDFTAGGLSINLPLVSVPVFGLIIGGIGLLILRRLFREGRADLYPASPPFPGAGKGPV